MKPRCVNKILHNSFFCRLGYQPKDMYTYVNYEFPFPSVSMYAITTMQKGANVIIPVLNS